MEEIKRLKKKYKDDPNTLRRLNFYEGVLKEDKQREESAVEYVEDDIIID